MGVDHRRADIRVAQQLLHGADIGAGLQQMRGKRMAQGMWRGRLGNVGILQRPLESTLERLVLNMMATALAA